MAALGPWNLRSPLEVRRAEARRRLAALESDYHDLHTGTGRWRDTSEGAAARDLDDARDQLERTRRTATAPGTRWRDRRTATKSLGTLTRAVDAAEQRWQEIGQPVADQLHEGIAEVRLDVDRLEAEALTQRLDRPQAPTVTAPERGLVVEL